MAIGELVKLRRQKALAEQEAQADSDQEVSDLAKAIAASLEGPPEAAEPEPCQQPEEPQAPSGEPAQQELQPACPAPEQALPQEQPQPGAPQAARAKLRSAASAAPALQDSRGAQKPSGGRAKGGKPAPAAGKKAAAVRTPGAGPNKRQKIAKEPSPAKADDASGVPGQQLDQPAAAQQGAPSLPVKQKRNRELASLIAASADLPQSKRRKGLKRLRRASEDPPEAAAAAAVAAAAAAPHAPYPAQAAAAGSGEPVVLPKQVKQKPGKVCPQPLLVLAVLHVQELGIQGCCVTSML